MNQQFNVNQGPVASSGYAFSVPQSVPTPKEPGLINRLQETIGYLQELAVVNQEMRYAIVGPEPSEPALAQGNTLTASSVEALLAEVCQRAAMCVSDARSLRARL